MYKKNNLEIPYVKRKKIPRHLSSMTYLTIINIFRVIRKQVSQIKNKQKKTRYLLGLQEK